jgi:hypothetical protein
LKILEKDVDKNKETINNKNDGNKFSAYLTKRRFFDTMKQQTADSRQQTADSRQQTADSRQQTADSRQQTMVYFFNYNKHNYNSLFRIYFTA